MTDLEMTRLCAESMGLWFGHSKSDDTDNLYVSKTAISGPWEVYDPLHDDAQAMALVKKFPGYCLHALTCELEVEPEKRDFNRAIVECVAKMQKAKHD